MVDNGRFVFGGYGMDQDGERESRTEAAGNIVNTPADVGRGAIPGRDENAGTTSVFRNDCTDMNYQLITSEHSLLYTTNA